MDRGRRLFSGLEYRKNHEISKTHEKGMKKIEKNVWKVNEAYLRQQGIFLYWIIQKINFPQQDSLPQLQNGQCPPVYIWDMWKLFGNTAEHIFVWIGQKMKCLSSIIRLGFTRFCVNFEWTNAIFAMYFSILIIEKNKGKRKELLESQRGVY